VNNIDPTGFNPILRIIDIIKDLLGIKGSVDCTKGTRDLMRAKERCQQQQSACWGPGSEMNACIQLCEETGFNPTSPSDDWYKCYRSSPEWQQFGDACGPSWYNF